MLGWSSVAAAFASRNNRFFACRFGRQHLDRNFAIKPDVLGQEHLTHPARTESLDNAVVRNLLWNQTSYLGAIGEHHVSEKANELERSGKNAGCCLRAQSSQDPCSPVERCTPGQRNLSMAKDF